MGVRVSVGVVVVLHLTHPEDFLHPVFDTADAGVVPLLPLRVGAQRVAGELRWRRGRLLQSHALHRRVL